MEVWEVIERLQNFPMNTKVYCMHRESTWHFNGDCSTEIDTCEEGPVEKVEMMKGFGSEESVIIY